MTSSQDEPLSYTSSSDETESAAAAQCFHPVTSYTPLPETKALTLPPLLTCPSAPNPYIDILANQINYRLWCHPNEISTIENSHVNFFPFVRAFFHYVYHTRCGDYFTPVQVVTYCSMIFPEWNECINKHFTRGPNEEERTHKKRIWQATCGSWTGKNIVVINTQNEKHHIPFRIRKLSITHLYRYEKCIGIETETKTPPQTVAGRTRTSSIRKLNHVNRTMSTAAVTATPVPPTTMKTETAEIIIDPSGSLSTPSLPIATAQTIRTTDPYQNFFTPTSESLSQFQHYSQILQQIMNNHNMTPKVIPATVHPSNQIRPIPVPLFQPTTPIVPDVKKEFQDNTLEIQQEVGQKRKFSPPLYDPDSKIEKKQRKKEQKLAKLAKKQKKLIRQMRQINAINPTDIFDSSSSDSDEDDD
jgi:hypothetical protein